MRIQSGAAATIRFARTLVAPSPTAGSKTCDVTVLTQSRSIFASHADIG